MLFLFEALSTAFFVFLFKISKTVKKPHVQGILVRVASCFFGAGNEKKDFI